MAYYDALAAKWATLVGSTQSKLTQINAATVAAPIPAILNVPDVVNAISPADYTALTQLQLLQMQLLLGGSGTVNASPGTTIRAVFQSIFSGRATTLANLSALVSPFDNAAQSWWSANGYSSPISATDLVAAGNLT